MSISESKRGPGTVWPQDIATIVAGYLDRSDQICAAAVSKQWYYIVRNAALESLTGTNGVAALARYGISRIRPKGVCLRTLIGHTQIINQLIQLSTGEIVSRSEDYSLKIWNPKTGECL